ncbi:hypothetical protein Scep_007391 [Stephania cephalantha]|uniref:Uncharacterized protein n=1 Tax=Stephania cephalantha TaxID=152367 RepID=A0AAP0KBH5_9MAGN
MGVSVLCLLQQHNYQDLEMEYEASKVAFDSDTTTLVLLDLLMDVDVPPLIETFSLMGSYEIDAIDIINESPCVLKRENVFGPSDAVDFVQQHLKDLVLGDVNESKVIYSKCQKSGTLKSIRIPCKIGKWDMKVSSTNIDTEALENVISRVLLLEASLKITYRNPTMFALTRKWYEVQSIRNCEKMRDRFGEFVFVIEFSIIDGGVTKLEL